MRLLIVGTLGGQLTSATKLAMDKGASVTHAESNTQALAVLRSGRGADLMMVDVALDIRDLAARLDAERIHVPIVACGVSNDARAAVAAIHAGAKEYIPLPPDPDLIAAVLAAVADDSRDLIYRDEAMASVVKLAQQIAGSDASVLITGESGTGKEVLARYVHARSQRAKKPFISVNCAAIPENLLESELFGHEKGAFTGALGRRIGKFEEANGGTLLLDEISEMDVRLQAKLLRALQEREIERVGGDRTIPVDVRVIAATNQPLATLIEHGRFREDLYYRLSVVPIHLPPLRERKSDIPLLVRHFVAKHGGGAGVALTADALTALAEYDWPGNVRELENFCERAVIMRSSDTIDAGAVRAQLDAIARENPSARAARQPTLPEMERQAVLDALRAADWNQSAAARMLGVPRHVLLYRLKKFGIDPRRPG